MNTDKTYSLRKLTIPIMIEMFLYFMIGAVDTLMVSRISDGAVAAVGISNQLFQVVWVLVVVVESGAGILITQKLGARKESEARSLALTAVHICFWIGVVLTVPFLAAPAGIARLIQVPQDIVPLAAQYLAVVGAGMVPLVLMAMFTAAVRATGDTKSPMYIGVFVNIIHIIGNYGFIFGAFGLPKWGLYGVALSTVISRVIGMIILYLVFRRSFAVTISLADLKTWDTAGLKETARLGLPMSINSFSWSFTQMVIFSLIATMGVHELTARTYMNTIESFAFMCGWSLAMAVQIRIAHLYGAGEMAEAHRTAWRATWWGLAIVSVNTLLIVAFGSRIMHWFTSDADVIRLGLAILLMNLLLQPGKMVNMAFSNALNSVSDSRFVMMIGLFSMWLLAAGLTYLLGISLGWGLIGAYIAMISDEYVRGVLSILRWNRRKWATGREAQTVKALDAGA